MRESGEESLTSAATQQAKHIPAVYDITRNLKDVLLKITSQQKRFKLLTVRIQFYDQLNQNQYTCVKCIPLEVQFRAYYYSRESGLVEGGRGFIKMNRKKSHIISIVIFYFFFIRHTFLSSKIFVT